jgi:hypothetical protein
VVGELRYRERLVGVDEVEAVMRDARPFLRADLRRSDVEPPEDLA